VRTEKDGARPDNAMMRRLQPLAERLPDPLLRVLLDAVDQAARIPAVAERLHKLFPITTVVSNVGATLALPAGAQAFGASFAPPRRFFAIGTLLGLFPLQDMVVARDGEAVIRPMLPLSYVFDHRLFDGVMSGRILSRLLEILADPTPHFGPDGRRAPAG
jgi:pyruvate/2-oxoglutarate dehydrogenase complex dihydrolipoamide acyltransferase (E2) component